MAGDASSWVVYGMPRAVTESGLANEVVSLQRVAAAIVAAVMRGSS
jgi:chemotaxis response regulator CheB